MSIAALSSNWLGGEQGVRLASPTWQRFVRSVAKGNVSKLRERLDHLCTASTVAYGSAVANP